MHLCCAFVFQLVSSLEYDLRNCRRRNASKPGLAKSPTNALIERLARVQLLYAVSLQDLSQRIQLPSTYTVRTVCMLTVFPQAVVTECDVLLSSNFHVGSATGTIQPCTCYPLSEISGWDSETFFASVSFAAVVHLPSFKPPRSYASQLNPFFFIHTDTE